MLDIGFGEILILAAAALFIFGPEKLPKLAADAARTFRTLRQMVASARRDLTDQLGPEFEGIDLDDLNPRTFVRKQLLDDIDADLDDSADEGKSSGRRATGWSPPETNGSRRANGSRSAGSSSRPRSDAGGRSNGSRRANGRHTPRHAAPLREGERPPYDADAT
jgi:sec-independent protein translocase protein TatB